MNVQQPGPAVLRPTGIEHLVDLESDIILELEVYHVNQAEAHTLEDSVNHSQTNQRQAGSDN